ncbi:MAG: DUF4065 domain-containing protein [Coriobacteriia bacterium]|nr:DUF4065 domain-containing protein [Coriobacteriia bacterium]
MVSVQAVADYILASVDVSKGDSITNLKLQKLVYYAQAWHLVSLGEPLFAEDIQAWAHGPAVYPLWKRFSDCGWHAIPTDEVVDRALIGSIPPASAQVIDSVLEAYSHLSAVELEDLTHAEDPWLVTRQGLQPDESSNRVIEHALMTEFYVNAQ